MVDPMFTEIHEAIRKLDLLNKGSSQTIVCAKAFVRPTIIVKKEYAQKWQFKKSVNRVLHVVFSIPVLGHLFRVIYLLLRLPQQIDRLRDEISYLHIEIAKSEQFITKQLEELGHQTRIRSTEIEKH